MIRTENYELNRVTEDTYQLLVFNKPRLMSSINMRLGYYYGRGIKFSASDVPQFKFHQRSLKTIKQALKLKDLPGELEWKIKCI